MNSDEIKTAVIGYLRYKLQFPLVALEVEWRPGVRYVLADVIAVDKKGRLVEVEVKTSISDMRADRGKRFKHEALRKTFDAKKPCQCEAGVDWKIERIPARFWYAVPVEIADAAADFVRENFPYAGLMVAYPGWVMCRKTAPTLHDHILGPDAQWSLVKAQSASLVRVSRGRDKARAKG